jgi:hypothetical protein
MRSGVCVCVETAPVRRGLARPRVTTTEAAPPFAVFERVGTTNVDPLFNPRASSPARCAIATFYPSPSQNKSGRPQAALVSS